jgi:hypothetical protein
LLFFLFFCHSGFAEKIDPLVHALPLQNLFEIETPDLTMHQEEPYSSHSEERATLPVSENSNLCLANNLQIKLESPTLSATESQSLFR